MIVLRTDEVVNGPWQALPFCACGWYPSTVPCPPCPPTTTTVTLTDTFTWQISTQTTHADGLSLKWELALDIGYTGTLTQQQINSLTGTNTVTVAHTLALQQAMCFTRFYRKTSYA